MARQRADDRSESVGQRKISGKQTKLFCAAAVSLALLALSNGASLAQSAPPLPGVIGQTSPLHSPYGGASNNLQGPASRNSSLSYSSMAAPCSVADPSTSALPTFDGGGLTLSVGKLCPVRQGRF